MREGGYERIKRKGKYRSDVSKFRMDISRSFLLFDQIHVRRSKVENRGQNIGKRMKIIECVVFNVIKWVIG